MVDREERMLATAQRVVEQETEAVRGLGKSLGKVFLSVCREVDSCQGKLIVTGMGKSGHVARKEDSSIYGKSWDLFVFSASGGSNAW